MKNGRTLNTNKLPLLRGLLSTLETVNNNLSCNGDCEECILEYKENECMGAEIATIKNRIAEMEGV